MGVGWVVEENGCQSFGGESYLVDGVLGQGGYAKVFDDDDDDDDDDHDDDDDDDDDEAMPRSSRPPESETAPSLPSRR